MLGPLTALLWQVPVAKFHELRYNTAALLKVQSPMNVIVSVDLTGRYRISWR